MKRMLAVLALGFTLALPLLAEDNSPAPDYSREKLLLIFRDTDFTIAGVTTPLPEGFSMTEFGTVSYKKKSLLATFLPLMPVLQVNSGAFGHAYSDQPVDPFYLLNVTFPYTNRNTPAGQAHDDPNASIKEKWQRKHYRKKMLLLVRTENSRDNG
ncbi:MAG: hypothetical protein ABI718_10100 [Acidobacteriota bacterium]